MIRRAVLCVAIAAAAVTLTAAPATAHARLVSTSPAGGATLKEAPERVRLNFSERIEASFAGIQVFDPDRERIDAGDARVDGDRVVLGLRPLTKSGRYTVVFRVISGDGHPVKSQFAFTYDPPAAQPTPEATPSATATTEPASETPTPAPTPTPAGTEDVAALFELEDAGPGTTAGLWASRLVNYLALTAVVGLLTAAVYLLPGRNRLDRLQRRLLRLAAWAAVAWAVSAGLLFVFALSSVAARALPQALDATLVERFLETRFGITVLLQGILAVAVVVAAVLARRRALAVAAALIVAVAASAPAWWGHAGTDEIPVLALTSAWLHIVAVTAWVGGLAVLAALVLRNRSPVAPAAPAQRFSRLAAAALGIVLVTGVINTLLHLGALGNLTGTNWGRLVIGKLVALAVITVIAWQNRNRLLPRLASGDGASRAAFRRMALVEVGVMVVAFGLATGLASGIPADAEAASRIQSVAGQLGDGQVNVTVDPAKAGPNLVHVYYLDANGQQREVAEPELSLTAEGGQTIEAALVQAGPGHYTVLAQQLPEPGVYELRVGAVVNDQPVDATFAVTVR